MTSGSELRKLKSEITSFECLNYEDLKFYTQKICSHIKHISRDHPVLDDFFKAYIDDVVLRHINIIEDFVNNIARFRGREEFVSKALKYHFNCVIDSYTYATLAFQH